EATNKTELLFFTNKAQVYKVRANTFEDGKASLLGDYIPVKLGFEEDEKIIGMTATTDYAGKLLFIFENGKISKIPLSAYMTKTNRKKLTAAFSDKSPVLTMLYLTEDTDILLRSDANKAILINTELITEKSTRSSQGIQVMTLRSRQQVISAEIPTPERIAHLEKYRVQNIPAIGKAGKNLEEANQMSLI
ncbi:MAG: topoisomerase IV, partial [Oscillospiraceae bacterium]|nr:topoisomerase IV [Oscillospiraceae bacterium]